jgi:hypothetical protein
MLILSCLCPLVYCFQTFELLNYLTFKYMDYERTCKGLFQKCMVHSKSDIYVFIECMRCVLVCKYQRFR